jgi:diacylglycerol kinase family enzyme
VELRHSADDRVFVQVDGEFAGHLPARVEIVPDALSLLVPPQYVRARPRRAAGNIPSSSLIE